MTMVNGITVQKSLLPKTRGNAAALWPAVKLGRVFWTWNLTVLPDWLLISGLMDGPIGEFILYILYFLNCIYFIIRD